CTLPSDAVCIHKGGSKGLEATVEPAGFGQFKWASRSDHLSVTPATGERVTVRPANPFTGTHATAWCAYIANANVRSFGAPPETGVPVQLCDCEDHGDQDDDECEHAWNHCVCNLCGGTRDADHLWDGCTCDLCGKTRDSDHRLDAHCTCARCGKEFHDWQCHRPTDDCARCPATKPCEHGDDPNDPSGPSPCPPHGNRRQDPWGCDCAKCGDDYIDHAGLCHCDPCGWRSPRCPHAPPDPENDPDDEKPGAWLTMHSPTRGDGTLWPIIMNPRDEADCCPCPSHSHGDDPVATVTNPQDGLRLYRAPDRQSPAPYGTQEVPVDETWWVEAFTPSDAKYDKELVWSVACTNVTTWHTNYFTAGRRDLAPDYDGDGAIDAQDVALRKAKAPFAVIAKSNVLYKIEAHRDGANFPSGGTNRLSLAGENNAARLHIGNFPPLPSSTNGAAMNVALDTNEVVQIEFLEPGDFTLGYQYIDDTGVIRFTDYLDIKAVRLVAELVSPHAPGELYGRTPAGLTQDPGTYVNHTREYYIDVSGNIPDSDITWVASGQEIIFVGSNKGRAVTVRGVSPGECTLTAHIAGLTGEMPVFHIQVFPQNIVPTEVFIVCAANGMPAVPYGPYDNHIYNMYVEANRHLAQLGIALNKNAEPHVITNSTWFNLEPNPFAEDSGMDSLAEHAVSMGITNILRVFFVNTIHGMDYQGAQHWGGIMLAKNTTGRLLAHEVLHACGLEDIYPHLELKPYFPGNATLVYDVTEQASSEYMDSKDWGAGYYPCDLMQSNIIERLIMHGQGNGVHIPHGNVWGLGSGGRNDDDGGLVERMVGLSSITNRQPISADINPYPVEPWDPWDED
ncbi:MAG: hypothetical protein FWF84_07655, partial [Kiritimatiellaeota bacterium]|nr:hypothetical protein [Kiritimatiellota bacterium]